MIAYLTGVFGALWAKVALAATVVALIGIVLLRARSAGRAAERVQQKERALESITRQRRAAARAPTDIDGILDSLRDGDF